MLAIIKAQACKDIERMNAERWSSLKIHWTSTCPACRGKMSDALCPVGCDLQEAYWASAIFLYEARLTKWQKLSDKEEDEMLPNSNMSRKHVP